jgi:KaiC/GvpD/RAD55 family RecA-like ATPase
MACCTPVHHAGGHMTISKKVQLVSSGISFLDEAWGGVYAGGSYIIVGPHRSGRTSLGLQFAAQAGDGGCVYFTTTRPRRLFVQAHALNLDLEQYVTDGSVSVVRIALPGVNSVEGTSADDVPDRFAEIERHVLGARPARVVFDEVTPFAMAAERAALLRSYGAMVESFEEAGVTSLFILGEPTAQEERSITEGFVREATASIYLQRTVPGNTSERPGGRMLIVPNVGHAEGQFVARYFVEAGRSLQIDPRESWHRLPQHAEWEDDRHRVLLADPAPPLPLDPTVTTGEGGARS